MKAKDFFEKTSAQGKIKNEDFDKFVASVPAELEVPDVWVNLFNENFLTRERAESDFKISQKIKAETLNAVDAKIAKVTALLEMKDREEIEKEPSSYKKIELLEKAIPNLLTKVKGENPNSDEKVKQLEKNVQEFADKVTQVKKDAEEREKELQRKFEEREATLKLDWTLDKKLADYTFADEFLPIKSAVTKGIIDTVKNSNVLQLDDKGQIVVVDIDPTTKVAKPKFNGNDPVTIDSLLSEPLKNFLKKNNANGGESGKKKEEGKRRETADDVDPSKMTLAQRRIYEAQNA